MSAMESEEKKARPPLKELAEKGQFTKESDQSEEREGMEESGHPRTKGRVTKGTGRGLRGRVVNEWVRGV